MPVTIQKVREELLAMSDPENAAFQSKLTPNIAPESFLGIRVPDMRKYAGNLLRSSADAAEQFLAQLPHRYFDENMLHALLISETKDFQGSVEETEAFLPYVDNWAVCDTLSPASFKKHKSELLPLIRRWAASSEEYTIRFGLEMLMKHYLDDAFQPEYLSIAAAVRSDKYYVNMMIAWFFATALAKQWNASIVFIQENTLAPWVHNKTIQKARESFRITAEQKEYLRKMKR